MSLYNRQQRTRVSAEDIVAQSSTSSQSCATLSLKSLSSIPTFGSSLSTKDENIVRVYLENVNGLNITSKAWKLTYKYRRLQKLWSCLQVDLINLVETKINPLLLAWQQEFKDNLFQLEIHHTIFSINSNKLIGVRQQGGVLSSARGNIAKFYIRLGSDSSNLGRWS